MLCLRFKALISDMNCLLDFIIGGTGGRDHGNFFWGSNCLFVFLLFLLDASMRFDLSIILSPKVVVWLRFNALTSSSGINSKSAWSEWCLIDGVDSIESL